MKTDNGLEPPTVLTQATNQLQADGGKSFLEPKSCKICITMPYTQQLCGLQNCNEPWSSMQPLLHLLLLFTSVSM